MAQRPVNRSSKNRARNVVEDDGSHDSQAIRISLIIPPQQGSQIEPRPNTFSVPVQYSGQDSRFDSYRDSRHKPDREWELDSYRDSRSNPCRDSRPNPDGDPRHGFQNHPIYASYNDPDTDLERGPKFVPQYDPRFDRERDPSSSFYKDQRHDPFTNARHVPGREAPSKFPHGYGYTHPPHHEEKRELLPSPGFMGAQGPSSHRRGAQDTAAHLARGNARHSIYASDRSVDQERCAPFVPGSGRASPGHGNNNERYYAQQAKHIDYFSPTGDSFDRPPPYESHDFREKGRQSSRGQIYKASGGTAEYPGGAASLTEGFDHFVTESQEMRQRGWGNRRGRGRERGQGERRGRGDWRGHGKGSGHERGSNVSYNTLAERFDDFAGSEASLCSLKERLGDFTESDRGKQGDCGSRRGRGGKRERGKGKEYDNKRGSEASMESLSERLDDFEAKSCKGGQRGRGRERGQGERRGRGDWRGHGKGRGYGGRSEISFNNLAETPDVVSDTSCDSLSKSPVDFVPKGNRGGPRGRGQGRGRGEGRSCRGGKTRGAMESREPFSCAYTSCSSNQTKPDSDQKSAVSFLESDANEVLKSKAKNGKRKKSNKNNMEYIVEEELGYAKHEVVEAFDKKVDQDKNDQICTIKVTITIKKCFGESKQLRDVFTKHFKVKNNKNHMHVLEDTTILGAKESSCLVIVTANSKQQVKRLMKGMCQGVKQELQVMCVFCVSSSKGGGEDDKEENPESREKDKCVLSQVPDHMSSGQSGVPTAETNVAKDKQSASLKGQLKSQQKHDISIECSIKIAVTITKGFASKDELLTFLYECMGDLNSCMKNKPLSVNLLDELTLCEVVSDNTANAQKLTKALNAVPSVSATICDTKKPEKKQKPLEPKSMEKIIERTVLQIEKWAKKELSKHSAKITEAGKTLLTLQKPSSSDTVDGEGDDALEVLALMDKVRELDNQKKEFETRIRKLKSLLCELPPLAATQKEIDDILRDVGIECNRLSTALPMYARRTDVVGKVRSSQVSIILGETGSGKSTQLVQYLLEEGLAGNGKVVCTQPRKVAALTLAERVSSEQVRKVGSLVGYKTGARHRFSKDTKILFYTDHTLLNECLQDPTLSKYSCIIIDEAHERSIYTDILLGLIKSFLPRRPDLKLIITSATINPEIFIKYFEAPPELRVSGRAFPVNIIYEDADNSAPFENYEEKAIRKVIEIHKQGNKGDILVFLTSSLEIMRCCEELTKRLGESNDFACFPLHGQMLPEEQKKAFAPLEAGKRKIVFSTNCAETSITIEGIKFVVDTGVVNEMRYDPGKNMSSLGTQIISQSSADQRKGRAGRTSSGTCCRLYTEESYNAMGPSNQPEILRVHLGQAVLKLAELGINVRHYEFVESPKQEAIDSAINVLQELGALTVEDAGITDVGRWLAKLPFDPRQSYIIYHGYQKQLLYDAVVLATLISNGSNMIYRGLNEKEEQASARSKSHFGSLHGDLFTWLEIYKTWVNQAKNEQTRWCKENCLNYKALSFTKQTVMEVRQTLSKELGVIFECDFSTDETSLDTLRRIIFDANLPSLCHYSGHKRGGYFAANSGRQVHKHPSSSLMAQNHHPLWVVYTQMTKTSRDFIRGITVVEERWVEEAISQGRLANDFMKIKELRIGVVYHEEVGQTVFRQLVGPRFSNLKSLEADLSDVGMSSVVVEAEKDLGVFEVHSSTPMVPSEERSLKTTVEATVASLRQESMELPLGQDKSGVRAVLGEGGSVTALFMPDQSNKVRVSKTDSTTTEESIVGKFALFGKVLECIQFKKGEAWGFVKYGSYLEARNAFEATRSDQHLRGSLMINAPKQNFKKSRLEARLSWCRRPIKGKGMCIIRCPPLERSSLVERNLEITYGNICQIKVSSKDENELVVFNTGTADEQQVKAAVLKKLDCEEEAGNSVQVNVVREHVDLCPKKLKSLKQEIMDTFANLVPKEKVSVQMMEPKKGTVNYVAFVSFDNAVDGFQACRHLRRRGFNIDGHTVKINPDLKAKINIPKAVMEVCQSKFEKIKQLITADDAEISVSFRPLKHGDFVADILTPDEELMVRVRDAIHKELEGEVINCSQNDLVRCLLKKQGLAFLKKIETEIKEVILMPNTRTEKIHIFGSEKSVTLATTQINTYLGKLSEGIQEDIYLSGPGKPSGLMKAILGQYPDLHTDLVNKYDLTDVIIDYKKQKLSVFGSTDSVARVKQGIMNIQQNMPPQTRTSGADLILPDCETCMCPVDSSSDLYRLEGCGHSYCLTCVRLQLGVHLEGKQFPLTCASEACGKPWVWKDIRACVLKGWVTELRLVERAVDAFVAASGDQYKFCPSPNCPVAYEVTETPEGCEFTCPSCQVSLCSSCHTAFHAGLTCGAASSMAAADRSLQDWQRQNADRSKVCPGCSAPVEKIGGCRKMYCLMCKTVFCWSCLQIFEDEQKCYAHCMKQHGDIY